MNYTREKLIEICERAIVPQSKWYDRDSESAQNNVGRVWQLLKCDCEFKVINKEDDKEYHTTDETIIIQFWVHNFMWFENGGEEDGNTKGYDHDSKGEWLKFYIPTEKRLDESNGGDWY